MRSERAHDQRATVYLGKGEPVGDRTEVVGDRIVFESRRQSRQETAGQRRAQTRSIDVDARNPTRRKGPALFVSILGGPTDPPILTGSNGSRGDARNGILEDWEGECERESSEEHGGVVCAANYFLP